MKNVLIIGSFGAGNIGDEAILKSSLCNLPKNIIIRVLSGNIIDTKKRHKVATAPHLPAGIRSFFSFHWLESIAFIKRSDLVLLGGGGLFTDEYSLRAVFIWSIHTFICAVLNKPLIIFANSIGPVHTKLGIYLTKKALSSSIAITVRDHLSLKRAENLSPKTPLFLGADMAFAYPIPEDLPVEHKKRIAINIRPWNFSISAIKEWIQYILSEQYEILFIAMEEMDIQELRKIAPENTSIVLPKDYDELLKILATCETCIGMRLHFLIAGSILGKKVAGISYAKKVQGVLENIEIPFLSPQDIHVETLKTLFLSASPAKNLHTQKKLAKDLIEYTLRYLDGIQDQGD